MKDKSLQEKNAAERQVELITSALGDAADCKGYWLNAAGKNMPKFYPKGVSVSPFNALVMGLNGLTEAPERVHPISLYCCPRIYGM